MSHQPFSLADFLQPVATCDSTASLDEVLAAIDASQGAIAVVVDRRHLPLGAIGWPQLARVLRSPPPPEATAANWMQPAVAIPIATPLDRLASQLNTENSCLLVDESGGILGQLDRPRLLAALANLFNGDRASPALLPEVSAIPAEIGQAPLLQLLEKLPIPLMLQAADGSVLAQNLSWREQICSTRDRCWLYREGERHTSIWERTASTTFYQWCNLDSSGTGNAQSVKGDLCPLCASGDFTGKGVWQFTKFPLDVANSYFTERLTNGCDRETLWLILASDITEQQQLCRELSAKNADLMQLNRLKDEFLACISHELKSPLTAVVGLSSLLKEQSLGVLNARQERYAGLIYQSGRQLMKLVNDILDLARLESGQLTLHPQTVSLREICDRAYKEARSQLERPASEVETAIEYSLAIEPDLTTIVADELRLRQMLMHLLSNALKFTAAGRSPQASSANSGAPAAKARGEVSMKVSRWEGWIAFAIKDTGIGIPAAAQHLIFQKFQQLENPMTRQFEGTGLGLVLTQRLARAHGGDVSFISEVGNGSEFTLLLPPSPPLGDRSSTGRRGGGDRIYRGSTVEATKLVLVVEATPYYIEQLARQLRRGGYRVAIARSGTEALEKARTFQPRAILLNPLLPLLSGWDVLTLLKADATTRHIPVLVTATRAEKQRAEQNRADGFLTLPVEEEVLNAALGHARPVWPGKPKRLTVLCLERSLVEEGSLSGLAAQLDSALEPCRNNFQYRILEAEDLEQADLLVRIWHPDAMLLGAVPEAEAEDYLQELSQYPSLATLPLVVLDAQTARSAHQVGNLSVFPCLVAPQEQRLEALRSAIQVAAGANRSDGTAAPHILVVNAWGSENSGEWLQALSQYLETAGYRTSVSDSWSEVYQQLQHQTVDLLLLDLGQSAKQEKLVQPLRQLAALTSQMPVLVLADDGARPQGASPVLRELEGLVQQVATQILPGHSQSMADLLKHIDRIALR